MPTAAGMYQRKAAMDAVSAKVTSRKTVTGTQKKGQNQHRAEKVKKKLLPPNGIIPGFVCENPQLFTTGHASIMIYDNSDKNPLIQTKTRV